MSGPEQTTATVTAGIVDRFVDAFIAFEVVITGPVILFFVGVVLLGGTIRWAFRKWIAKRLGITDD